MNDVFISFQGDDTRYSFLVHLYDALQGQKIKTHIEVTRLSSGEPSASLQRAIEESEISVVVFSHNYASSRLCLEELVHVLKCRRERGQIVIPVFHRVDPSHVREQKGSYARDLRAHEERFGHNSDKVRDWRAALREAASLPGWSSHDWGDSDLLVEKIVEDVLKKLGRVSSLQSWILLRQSASEVSPFQSRSLVRTSPSVPLFGSPIYKFIGLICRGGWARVVFKLFSSQFSLYCFLRLILLVSSATLGFFFLSKSSFFKLQFGNTPTSEMLFFGLLSAFLIFLVFLAPNWGDVLKKASFSTRLAVEYVFMVIVWILVFLIKYPRFDVHSKCRKSCVLLGKQGKKAAHGSQYTLFSVGAFSLLAVLLSSERQKILELGFFSILIGLIMDTSMEIPATQDGPNVWYILGSFVYCIGLIFFKHYIESSMANRDDHLVSPASSTHSERRSLREVPRYSLVLFSALAGIVCLYLSPFSTQQLEDSANLKSVCFIVFSLLFGFSLWKAREFIDVLVMKCHKQYLMKAVVKTFLFMLLSVVIFLTKYPRFELHSRHSECCKEQNGKKVMSQRNQYDVYSTGLFSLCALTMSSGTKPPVKLGIFSFLLELTMDSSIEILGNDEPNFFHMVFAAVYCALLILAKSYLDSLIERKRDSVSQQGSYPDQREISTVPNGREENGHGMGDVELGTAVEGDSSGIHREDTDSGDEPSDIVECLVQGK